MVFWFFSFLCFVLKSCHDFWIILASNIIPFSKHLGFKSFLLLGSFLSTSHNSKFEDLKKKKLRENVLKNGLVNGISCVRSCGRPASCWGKKNCASFISALILVYFCFILFWNILGACNNSSKLAESSFAGLPKPNQQQLWENEVRTVESVADALVSQLRSFEIVFVICGDRLGGSSDRKESIYPQKAIVES